MQNRDLRYGIWLTGLCLLPLSASAAEPVPAARPPVPSRPAPFVAGVDVPRQKPPVPSVDSMLPQQRMASKAACVIPGAKFVQKEPFTGGLEGSLLDDKACGIAEPVAFKSVAEGHTEVSLPGSVIVSCDFARTVTEWLLQDVVPAAEKYLDSELSGIGSGPGYQCRRRNNLPDGKLSEHALGTALDISHFEFRDGSKVSIRDDWSGASAKSRFLEAVHAAACNRFPTVLGPNADSNHKSHIHLDTGCHGRDCTYLICQ